MPAEIVTDRVAKAVEEMGLLLELAGENPFRSRAYLQAARIVEGLGDRLMDLVETRSLPSIKGIGAGLASVITDLATTGRSQEHEALKRSVPAGLLDMLAIPGLGTSKVRAIYHQLQIASVGELEYACLENRLASLQGFGPKSQERILEGIQALKRYAGRYLCSEAAAHASRLLSHLQSADPAGRVAVSGDLRRCSETLTGVQLVAETADPGGLAAALAAAPEVESVVSRDGDSLTVGLVGGLCVSLTAVTPESMSFPYLLYRSTGSPEHLTDMSGRAESLRMAMGEKGAIGSDGELLSASSEDEIFTHLRLPWIPPELREGRCEVEAAASVSLPNLVCPEDLKGILHVHTTYSDGDNSLVEMATAAMAAGYSYVGVCDHSRSAAYAGGLSPERVIEQCDEIARLNSELAPFRVLSGIESDILQDGSLDYDDDLLGRLDFVVASVHSRFGMRGDEMTERILRAVRNPYTSILGHPTGRLLLARDAYDLDLERVIEEAGVLGKVLELNAHPRRLDLDWRYHRQAKELGVRIAIDPDAHRASGLADVAYGVGVARKGWMEAGDVINTMDADAILDFFQEQRRRALAMGS